MRLVDADALTNHIKNVPTWQKDCDEYYWVSTKYPEGMYDPAAIVSSVENAPTIDAVEVVHGQWDNKGYCTNCGSRCIGNEYEEWRTKYCPYCGAKMKGAVTLD